MTAEPRQHGDGTRELIQDVALRLLLQNGYAGTALRSIAEAADLTTPALYWHFSSKGELCSSVLTREYERFSAAISTALRPDAPDHQLRTYVRVFVKYQLGQRRAAMGLGFDELVSSLPAAGRARIDEIQWALHDRLSSIIAEGVRERLFTCSDPAVSAFAITSMCNYVFTWYKVDGRLTIDQIAEGYADVAIRLVGGRPAPAPRISS